jgi:hypothetical protein
MGAETIPVKRENGCYKAYYSLDRETRRLIEYKLMAECDWAYTTMLSKMTGRRPIKKLERPVVIRCFAELGIDDPFNFIDE